MELQRVKDINLSEGFRTISVDYECSRCSVEETMEVTIDEASRNRVRQKHEG